MKVLRLTRLSAMFFVLGAFFIIEACNNVKIDVAAPFDNAHQFDSKVFIEWNNTIMLIDRYAPGYRPVPTSRALAYLGLSAYEATVSAIPENNSIAYLYQGLDVPQADRNQEYYWPAVVNASYAYLMERFFYHMENSRPKEFALINNTFNKLHDEYSKLTSAETLTRSEQFGRDVAAGVYKWESTDQAGHNAFLNASPTTYQPPQGNGKWQPTFPDYGKAQFPYWGQVRRFAMKDNDIIARPPVPYSENEVSLYYTQGLEVYNTVNNIVQNGPNAYNERWIAEFWSDDALTVTFSPAARLVAIANQVVEKEKTDLAGSAELYAKIGMALNDAGIAVWNSKFYYNVERPVDFIRRVISKKYSEAGQWRTILNDPYGGPQGWTPAFPAYPSGHSGFAGAGSQILSSFFEYTPEHPGTYSFTDLCHILRTEFNGTPRTFASFREMGAEDAYSRIRLGVHWRMDCDEGLRLGEVAAQRVLELPWKK